MAGASLALRTAADTVVIARASRCALALRLHFDRSTG